MNALRWFLVLPAAFIGYAFAAAIIVTFDWATSFVAQFIGMPSIMGFIFYTMLCGLPPAMFIGMGSGMAPCGRRHVATVLFAVHTFLLALAVVIVHDEWYRGFKLCLVVAALLFVGSILGLCAARSIAAEEDASERASRKYDLDSN